MFITSFEEQSITYRSCSNFQIHLCTTGDSYDNALAETVNGLYKTEVIEYLKADWQGLADVQLATALLHKDLKCKAPLIEPNLRRNLGKWST
ncbi:hypothetical protein E2K73_12790 [Acinetobacter sp. RF15A]|nr:hypothetical protein E5Y90_16295 [Acinetobacter sp. 10FS3-1]TSH69882.1 hypothetical protein E2K73_12790 [Acinetobacter sp. RF15A]TSI15150.1 hypothetical protein E2K74_12855 [Acinetobacter sp. RF15B]